MEYIVRRTLDQWIDLDAPSDQEAIAIASQLPEESWITSDVSYDPEQTS